MKRIVWLSVLAGLIIAQSATAGVTHARKRSGVPNGVHGQIGPITYDIRVPVTNLPCDEDCGTVEPPDFNVGPPNLGYWYTPPGRGQEPKSDQTYAGGGYISTEGARTIQLFVIPDDRWNVARVIVQYGRGRPRVLGPRAATASETFGEEGYRYVIGGLNGVRLLKVIVEYEDVRSRLVGRRTDCITINAERF